MLRHFKFYLYVIADTTLKYFSIEYSFNALFKYLCLAFGFSLKWEVEMADHFISQLRRQKYPLM